MPQRPFYPFSEAEFVKSYKLSVCAAPAYCDNWLCLKLAEINREIVKKDVRFFRRAQPRSRAYGRRGLHGRRDDRKPGRFAPREPLPGRTARADAPSFPDDPNCLGHKAAAGSTTRRRSGFG